MSEAYALGLVQTNAVDDRGVVERIGDDGVLRFQDGLKETGVGVKAYLV